MRRGKNGVFERDEVEKLLRRGRVCHLAVNDGGYPYVVPMNYGYAEGCLYLHCAAEGKKLDCLERDDRAAFSVVLHEELVTGPAACDFTTRYESVMGRGTVDILSEPDDIRAGLDALMSGYPECSRDYPSRYFGRVRVLRLRIEEMTGKVRHDA
jgi:nitroimidazol reductase NimA-like FMN-containing flavoprotein (pyridoxamine 5'-phosphate oxidase superfamily)